MYSQGICTIGQCLKNVKCETYLASNLFVVSTRFSLRYIQKLLLSCKSYRFLFRLDRKKERNVSEYEEIKQNFTGRGLDEESATIAKRIRLYYLNYKKTLKGFI